MPNILVIGTGEQSNLVKAVSSNHKIDLVSETPTRFDVDDNMIEIKTTNAMNDVDYTELFPVKKGIENKAQWANKPHKRKSRK